MLELNRENNVKTVDKRRKGFYRVGGAAAILSAALLSIKIIVFTIWPQKPLQLTILLPYYSNLYFP
jgi:hypothetical protein